MRMRMRYAVVARSYSRCSPSGFWRLVVTCTADVYVRVDLPCCAQTYSCRILYPCQYVLVLAIALVLELPIGPVAAISIATTCTCDSAIRAHMNSSGFDVSLSSRLQMVWQKVGIYTHCSFCLFDFHAASHNIDCCSEN
jgi:hypothetical protein